MSKVLFFISFMLMSCGSLLEPEIYSELGGDDLLTIYYDGNIDYMGSANTLKYKGKILRRNDRYLTVELEYQRPIWGEDTKVLKIKLLDNNQFRILRN